MGRLQLLNIELFDFVLPDGQLRFILAIQQVLQLFVIYFKKLALNRVLLQPVRVPSNVVKYVFDCLQSQASLFRLLDVAYYSMGLART